MTKVNYNPSAKDTIGVDPPGKHPAWLIDIAGACVIGANAAGRRLWGLGESDPPEGLAGQDGDARKTAGSGPVDWSDAGWPLDRATPALVKLEEQRKRHAHDNSKTSFWSVNAAKSQDEFEQTLVFWTAKGRLRRQFHGKFVDTPRPGLVMLTARGAEERYVGDTGYIRGSGRPDEIELASGLQPPLGTRPDETGSGTKKTADAKMPDAKKNTVAPTVANGAAYALPGNSDPATEQGSDPDKLTDRSAAGPLTNGSSPTADPGDAAVLREIARRIKTRIAPRDDSSLVSADLGASRGVSRNINKRHASHQDQLTARADNRQRYVYSFAAAAGEAAGENSSQSGSNANRLRASFKAAASRSMTLAVTDAGAGEAGGGRSVERGSSWGRLIEERADDDPEKPDPADLESAMPGIAPPEPGMSVLSAKLAHELRTPLSAIYTAAEILESERFGPIGSERYKGYAKDIHLSAAHALSVINAALAPGSPDGGEQQLEPTQVDLAGLIRNAVSSVTPLADKAGLEVVTKVDDDLPHVIADARCLKQMLLNLLTNAIKFNEAGGKIEITTAYELDGPLRFDVSDSGPGMSDEQIADVLGRQVGDVSPADLPCMSERSNKGCKADQSPKGMGYGLPLTNSMAAANGATLKLGRSAAGGLTASIVFNRDRVAPAW